MLQINHCPLLIAPCPHKKLFRKTVMIAEKALSETCISPFDFVISPFKNSNSHLFDWFSQALEHTFVASN